MFEYPGSKLKAVAFVYFIIGALFSLIYGLILMNETFFGLVFIILGVFFSWVTSLMIYAFGVITDEIKQSNKNTYGIYRLLEKSQQNTAEGSQKND